MSLSAPCHPSASSISNFRVALHSKFSAFFTIIPFPEILLGHLMFGPSLCDQVLWLLLTSVKQAHIAMHSCSFGMRFSLRPLFNRSPRVRCANFLSIYLSDLQLPVSDSLGLCFVWQTHPQAIASSASCSSGQRFTAGFLQIPPYGGHPCLWLTLPTIKARSGLTP